MGDDPAELRREAWAQLVRLARAVAPCGGDARCGMKGCLLAYTIIKLDEHARASLQRVSLKLD